MKEGVLYGTIPLKKSNILVNWETFHKIFIDIISLGCIIYPMRKYVLTQSIN